VTVGLPSRQREVRGRSRRTRGRSRQCGRLRQRSPLGCAAAYATIVARFLGFAGALVVLVVVIVLVRRGGRARGA